MTEYFLDRLDNGLRLVTVPMDHLHSAEMVVYLAVGGRHETREQSGIAHFLEHMLFRGTEEYSTSRDLERAFEIIGGMVNASTDAENTCFHSRLHPQKLEQGVALFASMLRRPLFSDIDVERRIILEEAQEDYNEQGAQINPDNLMVDLLWPGHPLGRSLVGTEQTIRSISLDQLKSFHQNHYTPANTVLCCCGPIDRNRLLKRTQVEFGSWEGGPPDPPQPAPGSVHRGPRSAWVHDSDSQVNIQLAFRLPGRQDPRTLQLRLLRRLLSWGGQARLSQRLREELGLTYAVEANCSFLADAGYLAVDLAVRPENLLTAIRELLQVFLDLRQSPVPQEELQDTVRSCLFDLDFSRDQPESQAVRYGWGVQADYLCTLEQEREELLRITPGQLQLTAAELFTREQLHLVITGPWEAGDRPQVEEILQGYSRG